MPSSTWPFFDLRLRTPQLELRCPTDDDLDELAALAANGVHPPDEMPFLAPWTRRPSPQLERSLLQWHWRQRAELAPESWNLMFVVVRDGEVVGTQDLGGHDFVVRRVVSTGSWVGGAMQGQGIGRQMRAAVLHLAFAGLGAEVALSEAWADNARSLAVTRALGYQPNGSAVGNREGRAAELLRFRLDRARWEAGPRLDVELEGLPPCLPPLGLA